MTFRRILLVPICIIIALFVSSCGGTLGLVQLLTQTGTTMNSVKSMHISIQMTTSGGAEAIGLPASLNIQGSGNEQNYNTSDMIFTVNGAEVHEITAGGQSYIQYPAGNDSWQQLQSSNLTDSSVNGLQFLKAVPFQSLFANLPGLLLLNPTDSVQNGVHTVQVKNASLTQLLSKFTPANTFNNTSVANLQGSLQLIIDSHNDITSISMTSMDTSSGQPVLQLTTVFSNYNATTSPIVAPI